MTTNLTETFGTNVAGRMAHFQSWLSEKFGHKADGIQSTLSTPSVMLKGMTPISYVEASDTGLQTVKNMLTPSRGC